MSAISRSKELLVQSQQNISEIPAKEVRDEWLEQQARVRQAKELVEALAAVIMPWTVDNLRRLVSDSDAKAQMGHAIVKEALTDRFTFMQESDDGMKPQSADEIAGDASAYLSLSPQSYDNQAILLSADHVRKNASLQKGIVERMDSGLPSLKSFLGLLQSELEEMDAHQSSGETHAQGVMIGQDTFDTQVTEKIHEL